MHGSIQDTLSCYYLNTAKVETDKCLLWLEQSAGSQTWHRRPICKTISKKYVGTLEEQLALLVYRAESDLGKQIEF